MTTDTTLIPVNDWVLFKDIPNTPANTHGLVLTSATNTSALSRGSYISGHPNPDISILHFLGENAISLGDGRSVVKLDDIILIELGGNVNE